MELLFKEDPVIYEVTATLRGLLEGLIDSRNELLTLLRTVGTLQDAITREQQINELKADIVSRLDLGNHLLGLDLVLRDALYRPVDPIELSPVKLYQLHAEAIKSHNHSVYNGSYSGYQESLASTTGSSLYTLSQTGCESSSGSLHQQNLNSMHLQLGLRNQKITSLPADEYLEVYFSVCELTNNNLHISPLTDKYLVQIRNDELICGAPNTVFTNLGPLANRDFGLLVQVYRVGRMTLADGSKSNFGKQQSNISLLSHTNGSNGSLNSMMKHNSTTNIRNRHSTLSGYISVQPTYKRPFGFSFVYLKDIVKGSSIFRENSLGVKVSHLTNESDFSQYNEIYPKKNQSKANHNSPNIQLELSVRFLSCPQESITKLSTLKPFCLTDKRGFPDVVMPGDFKNDLYLTLESAEFEKGGKSISKNIEASISLIGKSGLPIGNCIVPASNCDRLPIYNSCIFYHSNSPRWNESIKIDVPLAEFDCAHIRIEFRHCSTKEKDKKFLGFSFLPLSDENGAVIPDRSHELYIYKCDSQLWEGDSLNICKYTSLPYGPAAKSQSTMDRSSMAQAHNFSYSSRETVTVSTFLLSTKLTQNNNLLSLLKWRELINKRNNNELGEALKKVLTLRGEELVKFLQDILDTLFDTFTLYTLYPHQYTSTSECNYSALIFKVLVHIFLLLDEPKYQNFRPVLDKYAAAHFSATLVYKGLLACLKECLEHSSSVERHDRIQSCLRSIKYIFLFIVQSKLLYSKATGEHNDKLFLKDLRQLFKLFEIILSDTNPKLVPIQETLLQYFPSTLEHLLKVLNPQDLAEVVISLAGSVGWHLPAPLARAKLVFMRETATSSLLKNQDVRIRISENFCRHLDTYIRNVEELDLCYEVLEILVVKIHDSHWSSIYRLYQLTLKTNSLETSASLSSVVAVGEINSYLKIGQISANQLDLALTNVARELEPFINLMESLLQLLDRLVQDFNTDAILIQRYCTCLLTILKLMGKLSFEQFMKRRQLDYFKLCNLFKSLRGVYDPDWSIMQLTSHAILEHPIDEISKDMKFKSDTYPGNRQLGSYINLIVDFITHPTLQIEAFSERKRHYVVSVFGDLRLKYTAQLIRFWSDLGKPAICDLIPTSIQAFLDAALLPNDKLQHELIPFFWDIMDAEDKFKSSNFRQIERCLIDNLDLFMNLDRGNAKFVENFESLLKRLIKERSPSWEQRGLKLINSVTRLMQLLIDYRQSLETFDNRSKQMSCLVDLLSFYKDQERMDIYLKYLFKLCDIHLASGNHTEAAFTLKLYSDEIRWCNRNLGPLEDFKGLKFPEEQEWCRKEKLYHKIIHYFDLVDYEKVSSILKKLAKFLDNILTEHRPEREYFRVEFIGSDSPKFVRDKEFIYRGDEYERLATFIQRITSEFPDAIVLNSKSKQSLSKDCPGQYLVISNVKPVPVLQDQFKSGQRNVNDKIIQYYLNNRLDTFSYDLPKIKCAPGGGGKDKPSSESNVKNLWVVRYMLKTKKQLPDILPWCEVISRETIDINPINNAIETISNMNLELSKLVISYTKEPNKPISPLTMRLQGVIEAAVNGGPSVIVNAFFKRPPGDSEQQQQLQTSQADQEALIKLRDLFKQQYSILENGLALHANLAPSEVLPLHDRLVERLPKIRETLLEDTNPIENNYEVLNHYCASVVNSPRNAHTNGDHQASIAHHAASKANGQLADEISSPDNNNTITKTAQVVAAAANLAAAKDEVDGIVGGGGDPSGQDMNGNICGDPLEDQIYSQPSEVKPLQPTGSNQQRTAAPVVLVNGTRSELSSPSSRNYVTSGTSSSLSTLAVLSNLPVNRSRISLTPSKEVTLAYRDSMSSLTSGADTCARAARRLTFDSSRMTTDLQDKCQQQLERLQLPTQPATKPIHPIEVTCLPPASSQDAPPLPPKSYLRDKSQVLVANGAGAQSRGTLNRSPLMMAQRGAASISAGQHVSATMAYNNGNSCSSSNNNKSNKL